MTYAMRHVCIARMCDVSRLEKHDWLASPAVTNTNDSTNGLLELLYCCNVRKGTLV